MASSPSIKITLMLFFWQNGSTMKLSRGVYYLRIREKTLGKSNLVLIVVLVIESEVSNGGLRIQQLVTAQ